MGRLLFLCLLLLTGCQAETIVDVEARGDGSGTVTVEVRLDEEAAAAVPDLKDGLYVEDLERSGWDVKEPEFDEGETVIRASHGFAGEQQANQVLEQLSAQGSPFQNFRLTQRRSFTGVTTGFTGVVDLRQGVSAFGDSDLSQRFGFPLGFDPAEAASGTGLEWAEAVPVTVRFSAPGSAVAEAPRAADGEWSIPYGEAAALATTYEGINYRPLLWAVGAALALIGAILILILTRSGKYRPQHSDKGEGGIRARDFIAAQ